MKKYTVRKVYEIIEETSGDVVDIFSTRERAEAAATAANEELKTRGELKK